jgi:hypothetical protein
MREPALRPGKFDPKDTRRVKHTRVGVWDLYEELQTDLPPIPGASRLEKYAEIVQSMPYVVRMLKDILSIKRCGVLLSAYLVVEVLISLIPALALWYVTKLYTRMSLMSLPRYSGQLLRLVIPSLVSIALHTYLSHIGRHRNRDAYCGHSSAHSGCSRTRCMLDRVAHPPIRAKSHHDPFKHVHQTILR